MVTLAKITHPGGALCAPTLSAAAHTFHKTVTVRFERHRRDLAMVCQLGSTTRHERFFSNIYHPAAQKHFVATGFVRYAVKFGTRFCRQHQVPSRNLAKRITAPTSQTDSRRYHIFERKSGLRTPNQHRWTSMPQHATTEGHEQGDGETNTQLPTCLTRRRHQGASEDAVPNLQQNISIGRDVVGTTTCTTADAISTLKSKASFPTMISTTNLIETLVDASRSAVLTWMPETQLQTCHAFFVQL